MEIWRIDACKYYSTCRWEALINYQSNLIEVELGIGETFEFSLQ
jgi:hypothetical protein